MKQTAVQWLEIILEGQKDKPFDFDEWSIAFEHAKTMEKEQIVQAITKTIIGSNVIYGSEYPEVIHTAEQYYNETFKSE